MSGLKEQFRERGIPITAQRLAVMRAVSEHPHGTVELITESVKKDLGTVSRQAVYDSLALLSEKGLLLSLIHI